MKNKVGNICRISALITKAEWAEKCLLSKVLQKVNTKSKKMYDMKKIMVFTLFHIRKCIKSQNWSLMPWNQLFWDEIRAFRNYIFCNFHYIFCRFWLHKYYIFWAKKLHIFTGSSHNPLVKGPQKCICWAQTQLSCWVTEQAQKSPIFNLIFEISLQLMWVE